MAFFETWHTGDPEYYRIERGQNFSYPLHMHFCYEIIALLEGEASVSVDGSERTLRPGEMAVVFPQQVHTIVTREKSRHVLCIFAPAMLGRYSAEKRGLRPQSAFFTPPAELFGMFAGLGDGDGLYTVKGLLYMLLGAFDRTAVYAESGWQGKKGALLESMLCYIQENYRGECTLSSAARELKYDYCYLSKFFTGSVGNSFHNYVADMRVNNAKYLLSSTAMTSAEIARECGFGSQRSFDRCFSARAGMTPGEYRSARRAR